jgi:hypothetical protein
MRTLKNMEKRESMLKKSDQCFPPLEALMKRALTEER